MMKTCWARLIVLCALMAQCGAAADQFQIINVSKTDPESGRVDSLLILSGNGQFSLQPPVNFLVGKDEAQRKVSFSIPDKVSMQVQFIPDYAGVLPVEDALVQRVVQRYPGCAVLRSETCHSGTKSGWQIDVKRVFSADVSVTTSHAFIPISGGTAEFILSVDSAKFQDWKNTFGNLVNSFRTEASDKLTAGKN